MLFKARIIAKNTFVETLRQPIYAIIVVIALLLFLLSPSVAMYTLDEDIKMLREIGLSTLFLAGLFIAIFSATGAVTEEIESKTITTVISKPIGRPTFIIGKFLGVVAAVALSHYICTIALMMAIRHGVLETATSERDWPVVAAVIGIVLVAVILSAFLNYTYDWSFCSTAIITTAVLGTVAMVFLFFIDRHWKFNPQNNGLQFFEAYASLLLLFALIVLVAVAVMFSTRFNVILTMCSCIGVFLLGLVSDWVFGRFAESHLWAKVGWALVPNLQVFWISDAIYEGAVLTAGYLGQVAAYAAMYTTAALLVAIGLFQRRQVG